MPDLYAPAYGESRALVVGVNRYQHVSPLSYAVNDANGVHDSLVGKLGFPDEHVQVLIDGDATRSNIMSALLGLADENRVGVDDRLLVFFAGHGHTVPGRRGETGFLVPVDGNLSDLATLIRWDELTRSAELIPAKHAFFIMDACYGGLALKRKLSPVGSLRLLEDMMQRYSRQVLAAGKPDQTVSDAGGTRAGHSIFTSHLLDALDGSAAVTSGVITAAGVMAYVYDRVGNDPHSNQTPHYGTIDGDGDLIFAPLLKDAEPGEALPQFIQPAIIPRDNISEASDTFSEKLKRLLSSPSERIALDGFINEALRRFIQEASVDRFSVAGPFTTEGFTARVKRYENASLELVTAMVLLGRWADADQASLVDKVLSRAMGVANAQTSGLVAWINLSYYPSMLMMYAAGVGALSRRDYSVLRRVLSLPTLDRRNGRQPIVRSAFGALTDLHDAFKSLPGFDRRHTPRSDYIYQYLQPIIEDELFLGPDYDRLFDEFEISSALTFADNIEEGGYFWAPPGRFIWKSRDFGEQPVENYLAEATSSGGAWPPLAAGMYGGSQERFDALAANFRDFVGRFPRW